MRFNEGQQPPLSPSTPLDEDTRLVCASAAPARQALPVPPHRLESTAGKAGKLANGCPLAVFGLRHGSSRCSRKGPGAFGSVSKWGTGGQLCARTVTITAGEPWHVPGVSVCRVYVCVCCTGDYCGIRRGCPDFQLLLASSKSAGSHRFISRIIALPLAPASLPVACLRTRYAPARRFAVCVQRNR